MAGDPADLVRGAIRTTLLVGDALVAGDVPQQVAAAADLVAGAFERGNKLVLFGNGGSAADAQHIAAEFVGRFLIERRPLPAIALNTNGSVLSAVGNDYAFEAIFSRQVEALVSAGDVALGLSTSGRSRNVIAGLTAARAEGASTVALTGAHHEALRPVADVCISVPSPETPRIQEMHILLAHCLCEIVERRVAASMPTGAVGGVVA